MAKSTLVPDVSETFRLTYAILLVLAGGWFLFAALMLYALSGFGGSGPGDLADWVNVSLMYGGLLAIPAFVSAHGHKGSRAAWGRGLLWASVVAAVLVVGVSGLVDEPPNTNGHSVLAWAIALFSFVFVLLARLALALPVLAVAGTPWLRALALSIFMAGSLIGMMPDWDPLERFEPVLLLATVGLFVVLGSAYLLLGVRVWRPAAA